MQRSVMCVTISFGDAGSYWPTFLKRLTWLLFKPVGLKKADTMANGEKLNWFWNILYNVGYFLIFRPIPNRNKTFIDFN